MARVKYDVLAEENKRLIKDNTDYKYNMEAHRRNMSELQGLLEEKNKTIDYLAEKIKELERSLSNRKEQVDRLKDKIDTYKSTITVIAAKFDTIGLICTDAVDGLGA